MTKKAVLLANLGSPDNCDTSSVRRYLNQFLMDPYVIQLPWIARRLIVSLFVLPTRPKQSAHAYQSVWMEQGSPLIVLSNKLLEAVRKHVDIPVEMAMRYGKPSIESQLLKLVEQDKADDITFIPMYPHFADSTITTSVEQVKSVIKKHNLNIKLTVKPPFYQQEDYIKSLVTSAQPYLDQDYDHLIFSYHGLPESHIIQRDPTKNHCLQSGNCCQQASEAHKTCYRHHVMQTTARFIEQANITEDHYSVAFQSRLGRAKWLGPNTEDTLTLLAQQGKKKVLVICPAFVTDCLETLEEIAMQGNDVFIEAGGEQLTLIPCMNDHPEWVKTVASWCEQ
jgi:ferrochelatase